MCIGGSGTFKNDVSGTPRYKNRLNFQPFQTTLGFLFLGGFLFFGGFFLAADGRRRGRALQITNKKTSALSKKTSSGFWGFGRR